MSQNNECDMPDSESLEIIQNYLKQINSKNENAVADDSTNIMKNIVSFISNDNDTEKIVDVDTSTSDNISADIESLKEKIELQKKLDEKLNDSILKEKELLKITQEKLLCEVKLLETIKQRLSEEEKLKQLLGSSTLSNEVNITTQPEQTHTTNQFYETVNTNIESKTKVTKINSSFLKMYKR